MKVALVAAVARGGVIGRDGTVPWRLPEDMARFREMTMGHPVVMGRRTIRSRGAPVGVARDDDVAAARKGAEPVR